MDVEKLDHEACGKASLSRGRRFVLLMVNLVAFPVFSLPAYGFIHYMDLRGYVWFTISGWFGLILTSVFIWPRVMQTSGLMRTMILLLVAYSTGVIAWMAGVRRLLFPIPDLHHAWRITLFSLLAGGFVTICYWLPSAIMNGIVLRHRTLPDANRSRCDPKI